MHIYKLLNLIQKQKLYVQLRGTVVMPQKMDADLSLCKSAIYAS